MIIDQELIETFFSSLLEEALKEEKVGDEVVGFRIKFTNKVDQQFVFLLRTIGGRLESVTKVLDETTNNVSIISTIEIDENTLVSLINKTMSPFTALARGFLKIQGDKGKWRLLFNPARRAAARVLPLLNKLLPWPTFSNLVFLTPNSPKWSPDLPRCQICAASFGILLSGRHHCRICGRVVCSTCSSHKLINRRVCESCFITYAISPLGSSQPESESEKEEHFVHSNTLLGRISNLLREIESTTKIKYCYATTQTEIYLRSQSIKMFSSFRALQNKIQMLSSKPLPVELVIKHFAILSIFYGAYRILGTSPLSVYFLVSTVFYWKYQILSLALVLYFDPSYSLFDAFLCLKTNRPYTFVLSFFAGLTQVFFHYAFQRLLRIYSTAFFMILVYQSARIICDRLLKLRMSQKEQVFDTIDEYLAPIACNIILELKSVFVKFGQYLGARSDVVPKKWSLVLEKLQDDMPYDSEAYIFDLLAKEGYLERDFQNLESIPVASASIAQVHKAVYRDQNVAIKIQHENIDRLMEMDMIAFKRIVHFIVYLNPKYSLVLQILEAWEKEMKKELDFHLEAENLKRVKTTLKEMNDVLLPDVLKVTRKTLIMNWIDGFKITDLSLLDIFGVDRCALLNRVIQCYSRQIFLDGFFQADPHAGNLMVQVNDAQHNHFAHLILLDFGMCVTLTEKTRIAYCKLLVGLADMSVSELSRAISMAGYENSQTTSNPERDLEFFMFLLRDTGTRDQQRHQSKEFQKIRKKQRQTDNPDKVSRTFKQFPESLLFFMRTLGLLRGLCTTLDTPTSYLENMVDYARYALILDSLKKRANDADRKLLPLSNPRTALEIILLQKFRTMTIKGGYQISCLQNGALLVDIHGGSLSETDARDVYAETFFPLCDLTKLLSTLAVIHKIDAGFLKLESPLTGPDGAGATVSEALSHTANGMQDSIHPSSFGHQLRDYEKLLLKVGEDASTTSQKSTQAEFHTLSYGFELDLASRNSLASTTLLEEIHRSVLTPKTQNEILFDGIKSVPDNCVACISHGYAETVRLALISSLKPADVNEDNSVPSLSSLPILPGRVIPDAAMVNDDTFRSLNNTSFGAFGNARALANVLDESLIKLSETTWQNIAKVYTVEDNTLFGKLSWGLGFVVHDTDPKILTHHSFGGSFVLVVPSKRIVLCILISHLTIERNLTKLVVTECCKYFNLPLIEL